MWSQATGRRSSIHSALKKAWPCSGATGVGSPSLANPLSFPLTHPSTHMTSPASHLRRPSAAVGAGRSSCAAAPGVCCWIGSAGRASWRRSPQTPLRHSPAAAAGMTVIRTSSSSGPAEQQATGATRAAPSPQTTARMQRRHAASRPRPKPGTRGRPRPRPGTHSLPLPFHASHPRWLVARGRSWRGAEEQVGLLAVRLGVERHTEPPGKPSRAWRQ